MNIPILVEILIAIGTILGGMFALIRYLVGQNTKREGVILAHHEKQQSQMMEFYAKKNGHLERISNRFADSNEAMTNAVSKLTTEIKLMARFHK